MDITEGWIGLGSI